jgi:hypothetical protein
MPVNKRPNRPTSEDQAIESAANANNNVELSRAFLVLAQTAFYEWNSVENEAAFRDL